jgi:hypothetical protein
MNNCLAIGFSGSQSAFLPGLNMVDCGNLPSQFLRHTSPLANSVVGVEVFRW